MADLDFVKRSGKALEPGWVIQPEELRAICPTCKERVKGGVDGLIKHMEKTHKVKRPEVRHETIG